MKKKIKVVTIIGTRPEIIRLSEVIKACRKYFEGKFPKRTNEGEGIGIHPNRYFSSAMKIIKNENNKAKENENNYMDIDKEDIN